MERLWNALWVGVSGEYRAPMIAPPVGVAVEFLGTRVPSFTSRSV